MNKKNIFFVVVGSALIALLLNIFIGRWVSVKLSTWPMLNRFKLLSPQAPIVINTREEIRGDSAQDFVAALNAERPKLSLILENNNGQVSVLGSAINFSADGLVLTVKPAVVGQKLSNLLIKLDDGTVGHVTAEVLDPASDLVILKTDLNNVSVVDFSPSSDLETGQMLIVNAPSLASFQQVTTVSSVSQSEKGDVSEKDSDAPSRGFKIQDNLNFLPGQAISTLKNGVVGIWDNGKIISSDALKDATDDYFKNNNQIVRPSFGFRYKVITPAEQNILSLPAGVRVTAITPGLAAQKGGLMAGDIITAVGNQNIGNSLDLEQALSNFGPGDQLALQIVRGKAAQKINIQATQLK